jgi:hypothetical protein
MITTLHNIGSLYLLENLRDEVDYLSEAFLKISKEVL